MSDQIAERPPVPWEVHFGLQAEFVKLAEMLGVRITDGMVFGEAVEACKARARAAATKADQYEKVLALLDGAEDALKFALLNSPQGQILTDLRRARTNFNRALPLLRELAGKKA